MILVDSSIWIAYFTHGTGPLCERIDAYIAAGVELAATRSILQEVLQGARSESHLEKLKAQFASVIVLRPRRGTETYVEAALIYARCRWGGVTPRSSVDCLIVRIAVEHGATVFHNDRDFERLARFVPASRLA